jgi:hypothetical protein
MTLEQEKTFHESKTNELEGLTIFEGMDRQNLYYLKVKNAWGVGVSST